MSSPRPRVFAVAAAAVALAASSGACLDPQDGLADDADGGKEDRAGAGAGFVEVDASHSSATFRAYVGKALALLEHADAPPIARLTAASIRAGRVQIDELVDLTCWDFERARTELTETELTSEDYAKLRPGSAVAHALTDELAGYMWSNRIYVSRNQATAELAATLVHEVNHVINRSEVGYWDDLPNSAFVHEYRAFYAESMFDPTPYDGIDLVDYVLDLYELDRDAMDPDILANPLTPRLLPDAAAWRARRVGDDVADDDAACPGNI